VWPFATRLSVAARAARRVDRLAIGRCAAAGRQPGAVGIHVDVPRRDLRGGRRAANTQTHRLFRGLRLHSSAQGKDTKETKDTKNTHQSTRLHPLCPPFPLCPCCHAHPSCRYTTLPSAFTTHPVIGFRW